MKADTEEWNAQKCIMDLDNQSTASQSMSNDLQEQDQSSCPNQANSSEETFSVSMIYSPIHIMHNIYSLAMLISNCFDSRSFIHR